MKKNVGSIDRGIRILLGAVAGVLLLTGQLSGTIAIVLGLAAVVLLATSFMGICPLYGVCKISTRQPEAQLKEGK